MLYGRSRGIYGATGVPATRHFAARRVGFAGPARRSRAFGGLDSEGGAAAPLNLPDPTSLLASRAADDVVPDRLAGRVDGGLEVALQGRDFERDIGRESLAVTSAV